MNMEVWYSRLEKARKSKERFRTKYFQNMLDSTKLLNNRKHPSTFRQKKKSKDLSKYFSNSNKENLQNLNKWKINKENKNRKNEPIKFHNALKQYTDKCLLIPITNK